MKEKKSSSGQKISLLASPRLPFFSGLYFSFFSLFLFFASLFLTRETIIKTPETYPQQQQNTLQSIPAKTYVIKIKGPSQRQIVFCKDKQTAEYVCQRGEGITIEGGESYDFDFSGRPLSFGDIDQNGSVGVNDWSVLLACRNENAKRGNERYEQGGCKRADANFDGEVNNFDIDLFQRTLSNYPDDE